MKTVKRVQRMYEERNKLFEDTGLGDYAYSDEESNKFVIEALDKEFMDGLDKCETGLIFKVNETFTW